MALVQVLTSTPLLRQIASYQDGRGANFMKINPDSAAAGGHLNYLQKHETFNPTPEAYSEVMRCRKNPLKVTRYLLDKGIPCDFVAGDDACLHGHKKTLDFLCNTVPHPVSLQSIHNAATAGHLDVLKSLAGMFDVAGSNALHLAIASNHKHIVDWFVFEFDIRSKSSNTSSSSAPLYHPVLSVGQLHAALVFYIQKEHAATALGMLLVSPFLLCNRGTRAVDAAATIGDLSLLKTLFAYHGKESHCALDNAAGNGHLSVVKYLTGGRNRLSLTSGMNSAHPSMGSIQQPGALAAASAALAAVASSGGIAGASDASSSNEASSISSTTSNTQLDAMTSLLGQVRHSEDDLQMMAEALPRTVGYSFSKTFNVTPRPPIPPALARDTSTSSAGGAAGAGGENSTSSSSPRGCASSTGITATDSEGRYTIHATLRAVTDAAMNDHVSVVEYLLLNRYEGYDRKIFDLVAGKGQLTMLLYIEAHMHDFFTNAIVTTDAMDQAAAGGHLEVVEWLSQFRQEGCTTDALDHAAANGHLAVVQWLHDNRTEGATHLAMDEAAANGHLHVLEFLHRQRIPAPAHSHNNTHGNNAPPFAHLNPNHGGGTVTPANGSPGSGTTASTRTVHKYHCTSRAIDLAAQNGHQHVLKWLYEHYSSPASFPSSRQSSGVKPHGSPDRAAFSPAGQLMGEEEGGSTVSMVSPEGAAASDSWGASSAAAAAPARSGLCTNGASGSGGGGGVTAMLTPNTSMLLDQIIFNNAADADANSSDAPEYPQTHSHSSSAPLSATRFAFDWAAGNGHLEVLQFLTERYENLCSIASIELAARGGHVHVLQWLYDTMPEMFDPQLAGFESSYGSAPHHSGSTASALLSSGTGWGTATTPAGSVTVSGSGSKRAKHSDPNACTSVLSEAMSLAVRHGKCASVLWLQQTVKLQPRDSDCDWAARNGHLAMLLHIAHTANTNSSAAGPQPTIKALEWAVLNGYLAVVQYLLQLPASSNAGTSTATGTATGKRFNVRLAKSFSVRYGQERALQALWTHLDREAAVADAAAAASV